MKIKSYLKYIFFWLFFVVFGHAWAQVPAETPVVPIPLDETGTEVNDSVNAAVLKARYDSLVAHINKSYITGKLTLKTIGVKDSSSLGDTTAGADIKAVNADPAVVQVTEDSKAEIPAPIQDAVSPDSVKNNEVTVNLVITNTGVQDSLPLSTHSISGSVESDDDDAITMAPKPIDTTAFVRKTEAPVTTASTVKEPALLSETKPIITPGFITSAQDTPRIRLPKDSIKGDTMLLDQIGTEEQLVDTLSAESQNDIADGDDADEEGEAEGEFDNLFTGYTDVTYWDMLRDPNFKFDPAMIPSGHHYPFDWDTVVINPYKVSLKDMNDTIMLRLKDSMDCSFHPPAIGDITSTFGFRRWAKKPKFHYGVDVRMEVGDPVYAIFDGVVRVAKRSSDYGYVVLIRHYNGLETLYAHFDQLLAYPGKPVRSGEIIGLSGNTGRSTGPHLHFEVRYKGEKIDPNKIINFPSGSLMSDTLQVDKSCFSHLYKVQQTKLRSQYYVVKRGDTLGKIAYKNGVTVKQISKLNRISSNTKLKAGRRLKIR